MEAKSAGSKVSAAEPKKSSRGLPSVEAITAGVLKGDRTLLAKAITLIESNSPRHFEAGQELVRRLLPASGDSIRVGVTGVPGAGKSTFIESFGLWLIARGHKVAVLAVDPSSSLSRGSILGDKTRMEELARHQSSFIRPSPSGGALGARPIEDALNKRIAELEAEIERLTVHSDTERQDDKWIPEVQE